MSSRNRFLTEGERVRAPLLHTVMTETARTLADGRDADAPLETARRKLNGAGLAVDYLALVNGVTLVEVPKTAAGTRLIAAVRLGSIRLIDNIAA